MNGWTMELACCESVLLSEIAMKEITRKHLAMTYAMALCSSERASMDWRKVNEAIIARWSLSGLEWIKKAAWKLVENRGKPS